MKNTTKIVLILLLTIVLLPVYAQIVECKLFKDGVVMRDGKVYGFDKVGALVLLEGDKNLSNGTIVSKTGDYKSSAGVKSKLKNGEILNAKGELFLLSDNVIALSGALKKEGKVWLIAEGNYTEVTAATSFGTGLSAAADGTISWADGSTIVLKEGEFVLPSGEFIQKREDVFIMDGVSIRGGKAMKWEQGKFVLVTVDVPLGKSGAKVTSGGVVIAKDGTKNSLTEGASVNSNGELAYAKNELVSNGVFKRGGKMMELKSGIVSILTKEYTLPNGYSVSVDGYLVMGAADKMELKEGEMVASTGEVIVLKASSVDSKSINERTLTDHYIFRSGKMMLVKDGEPQILLQDVTFPNGTKLLKHGHVTKTDGAKHILKEGEKIDISGNFIIDKTKMDYDEKNHLVYKQGKVFKIKEGSESTMLSDMLMPDWSKVYPDGTIEKQNGAKIKMKEGDRINMEGETMTPIKITPSAASSTIAKQPTSTTPTPASTTTVISMKAGKLVILMGAKEIPMTKERVLTNGTKIGIDGTVVPKVGTAFKIKEGEKVDYNTGILVK